jgi:type IV pilus assembly protein PilM
VLWLEMMKALNKSLPLMADGLDPKAPTPDVKLLPFDKRKDLKITQIETQFFPELSTWFTDTVKQKYLELNPELLTAPPPGSAPADGSAPPAPGADVAAAPAPAAMPGGGEGAGGAEGVEIGSTVDLSGVNVPPPTGPGWVVELQGYHFYNDPKADRRDIGSGHVRKTLLKQLKEAVVNVPAGPGQPPTPFTMKELGIGYAILAYSPRPTVREIPNPNYAGTAAGSVGGEGPPMPTGLGGLGGGMGPQGGIGGIPGAAGVPLVDANGNPASFKVNRYDFAVQFVWQEKPLNVRLAERKKKEEEAKAAAAAAAAAPPADGSAPAGPPAPGAPPASAPNPAAPPGTEAANAPAGPQSAPAQPTPAETAPAAVSPANGQPASGQPGAETPVTPAAPAGAK